MVLEHLCLNPLINPNPYNKSKKIKGGNLSLKTISRSVIHLHFAVTCLESNEVNGQKEQELQEQTAGRSAWGFSSGVWAGVHQTRLLSTGLYHQKTPCSHCNLYGMEWTETSYFSFSSHLIPCCCFISLQCAPHHPRFANLCYQQQQYKQLPVSARLCSSQEQVLQWQYYTYQKRNICLMLFLPPPSQLSYFLLLPIFIFSS